MYKVLNRTTAPHFPKNTLTLWYKVDFDGENREWRECVSDIIERLSHSYQLTEKSVPQFEPYEDFVELVYEINGNPIEFSCDFTLYSIFITTINQTTAEEISHFLGQQVGWGKM